ncbi:kinesin-like protein KIF20A isoform X3 [Hemicordylus capensis]|uniref:kinesin-like protein KIF20A isoform X3 n=1 Tax=Hemicordylus capensis TaxID=884348 RepID=UPI0023033C27|nr:kinesin-like protein KIF20A isoform X3 [Hemicordylus capensis]
MDCQERAGIPSAVCGTMGLMSDHDSPLPVELSEISSTKEQYEEELCQPLKVYLRVRPFSNAELENNENQGCLIIENQETVTLQAPKESAAMKNSEKGIGQPAHQFTFTQVFGPDTTQKEFFEGTMKEIVKAYTDGVNGLVFTYGVTNAGKSFTVQDQHSDLLDSEVFNCYPRTLSSVWVSFFEIYNEYIYDLLDLLPTLKHPKRKVLRICEDQSGNAYIKDLKWINVNSVEEACKILKTGNKNRSLACTRMNRQSSRSHSIFSIRLLNLSDENVPQILGVSELSLCDLAGSERCNKTHSFGDRLKEAGNINNSLLILGKCIAALKQNQNPKLRPAYIPFRESKLTRLFQPFFCGKGNACMIVNINQCASMYDETLHVMKFSAVAKQVIQTFQPQIFDYFPKKYIGRGNRPTVHFDDTSAEEIAEVSHISSEEEEMDVAVMSHEDLLKTTEILKEKLVAERRNKLLLEVHIRKEMAEAMFQQLMETEEAWSKRLEDIKEHYEEKLESKFEMYKEAIKKHAYMCAMEQIEEHYVSIEEFIAEQAKVEDRDMKILQLKLKLGEQESLFSESPTSDTTEGGINPDDKSKMMQRASYLLQRQCEEKDELIKSLKLKIQKLNEMLQDAKEICRKTAEENNRLKQMVMFKEQEVGDLQNWVKRVHELEATISLLQAQLDERKKVLSTKDFKLQKSKKGFFANLKYTIAEVPKASRDKDSAKLDESLTASPKLTPGPRKVKE